jgi:hypothetical protein
LPACDGDEKAEPAAGPEVVAKVEGTVSIGGKAAKVTDCKTTARDPGYAVDLTLDNGLVLTYDVMEGMQWRKGDGEAQKLTCDKNASSMSGGKVPGGAFLAGTLGLSCTHPDGPIEADLTIDCGPVDRPSNASPNAKPKKG